ncbi:glycosyltransferase 1 domain-containing protein 1 isoform X2 [Petromyzon marinus]|uniref:Glycosyltransferase 1 domain-containing protein 1 isoform X2 n=1 Tax=Petromyzon marinus TaxID=7757 RepID=A0AAJ7SQV2_PETMA|nr:glycosyltransferase 1 domain-containing protein 1 isoform X2 [Petromyzon marinus]
MKVLLLAPTAAASGNATTAERIRHYLLTSGHKCLLENSRSFSEPKDVRKFISVNGISAVIALHLYKAGRLLVGCGVPYGVVFGGTDVNEDVKNEHKLSVMTAVAQNARFLVAFTEELKCIAEHLWPCTRGRVYIQPQGVPADANSLLFLLVCGIRQVKDPLYLTDTFSEWQHEDSRVHLIIIGPEIDSVLSAAVKERTKMARGVWLLPELPQNQLHAAMSDSFCLVNSSLSEGMSGAILEAMQLGLPVIARDIPGNAALITHEETGLLYTTAQEFKVQARRLMTDMALRERLVPCARRLVEGNHSQEAERRTYTHLLLELSGPEPVAGAPTASG